MNKNTRYKYLTFVLIVVSIIVRAQKKDTIFIKKDKFQKIFIEKNKNSDYYQLISDFTGFNILKDSSKVTNQILSKWLQIKSYKGKYFLYYPCDQINDLKYVIDSEQIQIKNSEIVTYKIISVKKKNQDTQIKYQEPNSQKKILLKIRPINKENGIYQFITVNGTQQYESTMIQFDKYKNYNLIVNECSENKSSELNFEHYKQ